MESAALTLLAVGPSTTASTCRFLVQDVAVAVELGMGVALLLFVKDVTQSMHVRALPPSTPMSTVTGTGGDPSAAAYLTAGPVAYTSGNGNGTGNGTGNGYHGGSSAPAMGVPESTVYLEVRALEGVGGATCRRGRGGGEGVRKGATCV